MPLFYDDRQFTPELCRMEPDTLFVFGDNLTLRGKAGQAVIRGEPNAVGIYTKRTPSMDRPRAFFSDADYQEFERNVAPRLTRLRVHLHAGGYVAWPAAGIGTGLAQLPERSPRCWAALERARLRLEEIGA